MTRSQRTFAGLVVGVLLAGLLGGSAIAGTNDEAASDEIDREALEARLDEARQKLDAAARELGEIHRKLYARETVGSHGNRPMLGVLIGGPGDAGGVKLVGVTPGGGADEAGLQAGDEITSINGLDLTVGDDPMRALRNAMADVSPGDAVAVGYQRGGSFALADVTTSAKGVYIMKMGGMPDLDIDIGGIEALESLHIPMDFTSDMAWGEALESLGELEELKELKDLSSIGPRAGAFVRRAVRMGRGLKLVDADADLAGYFNVEEGVLVVAVPAASTEEAGVEFPLKGGDIILSIGGDPVDRAREAYRHLLSIDEVTRVEVLRQGGQIALDVDPESLGHRLHRKITIRRGDGEGDFDVRIVSGDPP
jgi:membrane-associated protease RseP (regulator of RpoE activity)